jgi:hypothetical protein
MVPLPITTVDFTGGYVAIAAMIDAWRFHAARRVAVRNIDPEATRRYIERLVVKVRRWVERPTDRPPLSRKDMERLAFTLVEVIPDADVFPRKRRNEAGTAWRMQVQRRTRGAARVARTLLPALALATFPREDRY